MTLDEKLMKTLTEVALDMQRDIKKMIKLNGSYASGTLYDSVKAKALKLRDGQYSIEIDYVYYGMFVQKGRNPGKPTGKTFQSGKYAGQPVRKLPPINDIREWTKLKGIPDTAVFPIARHIAQEGYKGKSFMKGSVDGKKVDIRQDYATIGKIIREMGAAFKSNITDQIMRDNTFFGVSGIPKGTYFKSSDI